MAKKIKVHEKALAHLTRGLYRSPASALRELVSNAWDANAKIVRVDTNYPKFFQLSVEDNGDGFTREDFDRVMSGGIGNSEKRRDHNAEPLLFGRPTVGRLGIGMLGIAQVALGFTITSRTAEGTGFRAHIKLYDLLKPKLDKDATDVIGEDNVVNIGTYEFDDDFNPKVGKRGTSIITNDLHPQFTQAFKDSVAQLGFKKVPNDWKKAIKILSTTESLQQLGDYWRLLWELAASAPIRYIDATAVPNSMIKRDQERLESYQFRLIVDNVELFKPVYLRGDRVGFTTHDLKFSKQVYGKPVAFHGYIAVRDGSQIKPDELRGLMIRIKNIGIGYYDSTLLDYRINQGPRSRWLTGEIYVDEGLEDALNIDRDSFNRFHPDFRAIQESIHKTLKEDIFPKVYVSMDERSAEKAKTKERTRKAHIRSVINEASEKPVHIRVVKPITEDEKPHAVANQTRDGLELTLPDEDSIKTKKIYRQAAAAILGIFELAIQEKTTEQKRARFTKLLLKLFAGW